MIRRADISDLPAIVALLCEFHCEADQPYGFDGEDAWTFMEDMVNSEAAIVLVSPEGFICGIVAENPVNREWKTAYELYWYANDGFGAALMKSFEQAAADLGVNETRISHRSSTPRIGQHLAKRGYVLNENVYARI